MLKESKSLKDELVLLKIQIVDQESKLAKSGNLLEETKEKCKAYEEEVSLLGVPRDEAHEVSGVLENELVLKGKGLIL